MFVWAILGCNGGAHSSMVGATLVRCVPPPQRHFEIEGIRAFCPLSITNGSEIVVHFELAKPSAKHTENTFIIALVLAYEAAQRPAVVATACDTQLTHIRSRHYATTQSTRQRSSTLVFFFMRQKFRHPVKPSHVKSTCPVWNGSPCADGPAGRHVCQSLKSSCHDLGRAIAWPLETNASFALVRINPSRAVIVDITAPATAL